MPAVQHVEIVAPAHNEEENVELLWERLQQVFAPLADRYSLSLLIVDDRSSDTTYSRLTALHEKDPRVRAIRFSRQFGHQLALKAGLDHADGDVVIMMDSDLQHPPEKIPELLAAYEAGASIVFTQRAGLQAGLAKRFFSDWFYRLTNRISRIKLIPSSSDFRLIDRKVLKQIQLMNEYDPFYRGLFRWVGYESAVVTYELAPRAGGRPTYRLRDSARLAISGITSFSTFPLEIGIYVGIVSLALTSLLLVGLGVYCLAMWEIHWPMLMFLLILFLGSIQITLIGMIGEYVGRMFMELKQRPLYVVDETVGVERADAGGRQV